MKLSLPLTDAQRQRASATLDQLGSAHAEFEAKLAAFAEATATRTTLERQVGAARYRLGVSEDAATRLAAQLAAIKGVCQTRKGEMEEARAAAVAAIGLAGSVVREIAGPLVDHFKRGLESALQPFCMDAAGAVAALLPTNRTELAALQTFLSRGLHVSRTATAEDLEFLTSELSQTLQAILDGGDVWRLPGQPAAPLAA